MRNIVLCAGLVALAGPAWGQQDQVSAGSIDVSAANSLAVSLNSMGVEGLCFSGLTGTGATLQLQGTTDGWAHTSVIDTFTVNGCKLLEPVVGLQRTQIVPTVTGTGTVTVNAYISSKVPASSGGGSVTGSVSIIGTATVATVPNATTLATIPPITISNTGTAACFASATLVNGMAITAQHLSGTAIVSNTNPVFLGPSTVATSGANTGDPMVPGSSRGVAVSNASGICINGTAGDGATATGN